MKKVLTPNIVNDIMKACPQAKGRLGNESKGGCRLKNQKELFEELKSSSTMSGIQLYIKKVLKLRGFANQTVKDKLLLLAEEVGELAKAVRKNSSGASVDPKRINNYDSVESEIADILIVLISIANVLDIDVFESLKEKEKINISRKWKINSENKESFK